LVYEFYKTGTKLWHQRGTSTYEKAEKHID